MFSDDSVLYFGFQKNVLVDVLSDSIESLNVIFIIWKNRNCLKKYKIKVHF